MHTQLMILAIKLDKHDKFLFLFIFQLIFINRIFVNGTFKSGNAINIFKYGIMIDYMAMYEDIIYQDLGVTPLL